jgi:hypothetical protein
MNKLLLLMSKSVAPPTFVSAEVGTVNASTVAVTFSRPVTAVGDNYDFGVTINVNSSQAAVSSTARQANPALVYYVLVTPIVYGDTVTWGYTAA